MATRQELVQDLSAESPIDLFTLSGIGVPTINFCNVGRVTFGGIIYNPIPCKVEWLAKTSEGTEPRIILVVSDVNGDVAELVDNYPMIGADFTAKRTWSLFLDGQPGANATEYTEFRMRVNQYSGVYSDQFEFTLMPSVTLERRKMPNRSYLRRCQWTLSSAQCGARSDIHYDLAGNPTTAQNRNCSKDPRGCILYQGNTHRYGGFLGVQRRG